MTKKSYFHFRITHDEKERWQKFADKEFDGAISKLVRASVTGFINATVTTQSNEVIIEKLDGLRDLLIGVINGEDPDPELSEAAFDDDDDKIIYQEVDKSKGKGLYDF